MTMGSSPVAARLLPLIDLTSLNDTRDDDIAALCAKAATPFGPVAAVCSWPQFTAEMVERLSGGGPKVAVVVDFPHGTAGPDVAAAEAAEAVKAGADELDLVMPYRAWLAGDKDLAQRTMATVKTAAGKAKLKVILETGALGSADAIKAASEDAIAAGADMLKTSSGKIAVGATVEAAEIMLKAIHDCGRPVGFKAAGGIRDLDSAAAYLALADRIMGSNWASPLTFRVGASKLLDVLIDSLTAANPK